MNFFEAQERARKSSRMLVWWFILSVLGVIAVMYLLAAAFTIYSDTRKDDALGSPEWEQTATWWDPGLLLVVAAIVGGVIMTGSWVKLAQLSSGGKVVAQGLGGRPVEPTTTDLSERRLLNVVEEMAIASGVPVPEVWIMDEEQGINAFAAGTDPTNAVIGVTRGTLDRLTRSELQGVVAHEFSHILNGDMKLNMRLMGWIFGLVMLSMLGRIMLESFRFMRGSRDSKGGGVVLAIIVAGLAVWLVGSIGVLFARMLQAAISRQREYLADASAVQFTRDPGGISGALKKIGGFAGHGKISSPKAMESRHMFFAGSGFSALMATHPPLEKRILAVDPQWKGEMLKGMADPVRAEEFSGAMGFSGSLEQIEPTDRLDSLGDSARLDSQVGARIRDELRSGKVTSFSKQEAKTLLLGLLVAADSDGRAMAERILLDHGMEPETITQVVAWSVDLEGYDSSKKLALVDLSLSWLRKMSQAEAWDFVAASQALIEADGEVNLFEFMLQKVIERHVCIGLGLKPVPAMRFRKLEALEAELADLLGAFASLAGGGTAIDEAAAEYREHTGRELPRSAGGLADVARALGEMDAATPLVKQRILRMCGLVVMDDGVAADQELELLRATAEAIGAPVPPLVRGGPGRTS
jgi:Zn-dependent protease with chaperone function